MTTSSKCFCGGEVEHEAGACPYAPTPFYSGFPDIPLIRQQIERGYVHLDVQEGKTQIRIQAGRASKRARTTWVVAFKVESPGNQTISMQKRLHLRNVEDELLGLVLSFRQRYGSETNAKPS